MPTRIATIALALCAFLAIRTSAQTESPTAEIDRQVWSVISKTVVDDDIVGMAKLYENNAVLVTPNATTPIKEALERWGKDMVTNKGRGDRASVEFRFSHRQDDRNTAFEVGMFKYTVTTKAGVSKPQYVPMEALLVKTGGQWRIVMERQLPALTQADWDKLAK